MEYITKLEDAFLNYEKLTAEEKEHINERITDNRKAREVIKDLEDMASNKREEDAYWKGYVKKQAEAIEICKTCSYRIGYQKMEKEKEQQAKKEV